MVELLGLIILISAVSAGTIILYKEYRACREYKVYSIMNSILGHLDEEELKIFSEMRREAIERWRDPYMADIEMIHVWFDCIKRERRGWTLQ